MTSHLRLLDCVAIKFANVDKAEIRESTLGSVSLLSSSTTKMASPIQSQSERIADLGSSRITKRKLDEALLLLDSSLNSSISPLTKVKRTRQVE